MVMSGPPGWGAVGGLGTQVCVSPTKGARSGGAGGPAYSLLQYVEPR